ncbi:serine/threonine protein phosphatase [Babesia caballi]|uniref:Serine/threonine protein phosphatase n=1 Tax=Babesia caballi TaxID=5871 RepID=A0AAV4LZU0_BABCB|nr:serine/threonine protein phosphatase [Babesia caballi]
MRGTQRLHLEVRQQVHVQKVEPLQVAHVLGLDAIVVQADRDQAQQPAAVPHRLQDLGEVQAQDEAEQAAVLAAHARVEGEQSGHPGRDRAAERRLLRAGHDAVGQLVGVVVQQLLKDVGTRAGQMLVSDNVLFFRQRKTIVDGLLGREEHQHVQDRLQQLVPGALAEVAAQQQHQDQHADAETGVSAVALDQAGRELGEGPRQAGD